MDRPTDLPAPVDTELAACVVAFASAVKNLTIYPKTHPRVVQRAEEVAGQFAVCGRERCELTAIGGQLAVDGRPIATDNLAVDWLVRRCRESGLRGILIERGCSADDVVQFATALVACRPGTGGTLVSRWQHDNAHVRPLELVVEDHHVAGARRKARDQPPTATKAPPIHAPGDGYAELLMQVSERPGIRDLLHRIESSSISEEEHDGTSAVDMLGMIGELLPIDVPRDADQLAGTVENILARVHCELNEMLEMEAKVKGADLLRNAIGVARSYFAREATPETESDELPTGRPGDERYAADLDALLAEYEALPESGELHLPESERYTSTHVAMARELLGAYLHGVATDRDEARTQTRIARITELVRLHHDQVADLLDIYLVDRGRDRPMPMPARIRLLDSLAANGLLDWLRQRGYVTNSLLTAGFPDVWSVAHRLFGRDEDLPPLETALATLAPILAEGGAAAVVDGGFLDAAETIDLLARIGGPKARLLLSNVRPKSNEAHAALCRFADGLPLPPAEAAVFDHCRPADIPRPYLAKTLRCAAQDRFDEQLRENTGELLRELLTTHRARLTPSAGLELIATLRHVPCVQTEELLRHLAQRGRFVNFTQTARMLRRQAAATLAAIRQLQKP